MILFDKDAELPGPMVSINTKSLKAEVNDKLWANDELRHKLEIKYATL